MNKHNFSIRLNNKRFDIIFKDDDQSPNRNPYFILNEDKSLYLSKGSYIKFNFGKDKDYKYYDTSPEQNTESMFNDLSRYFEESNKSSIKFYKNIDNLHLDISNFFIGDISSLISIIWSLIINLTDNYSPLIKYLETNCLFLERDMIKTFKKIYELLDINEKLKIYNPEEVIKNMKNLSFFCAKESMLWKYRFILNRLKLDDDEEQYYDDFKDTNIEDNEGDIKLIENEIGELNKLKIYWEEKMINEYIDKLKNLKSIIDSYNKKDKISQENKKLINEAKSLLYKLDEKIKNNNKDYSNQIQRLKGEVFKFIFSENLTQEKYKVLQDKVNLLINLIQEKKGNNIEYLNLPNREKIIIMKNSGYGLKADYYDNYEIYDLIFWFSLIQEQFTKLLNIKTITMEEYEKIKINERRSKI